MVIQINLVADNNDSNICSGFLVEFLDPLLALFEAVSARHIKHDACADRILVVHLCQRSVPLLSRRIPHLILNNVVSKILVLCQEAPSNSGFVGV